jgi:membrane protein DedA with SNARE-associated domain
MILLLPMEAGIPVPLPADLVMFSVGERVGAGQFPLWLAVAAFEIVAVAGTAALFAACQLPEGPRHASRLTGRQRGVVRGRVTRTRSG